MTKPPKPPRLCAYCSLEMANGSTNKEHFVAKCFWADSPLPQRMKTIRIHKSCNTLVKDDSEYLRDTLVMIAGTREHPVAARILDGPIMNKIKNDPGWLISRLGRAQRMPVETSSGLFVQMAECVPVDIETRDRALKNIVRGVFFKITQRPLDPKTVFRQLDTDAGLTLLPGTGKSESFGDDVFQYRCFVSDEDPNCILIYLRFYQRHTFGFVTVSEGHIFQISAPSGVILWEY